VQDTSPQKDKRDSYDMADTACHLFEGEANAKLYAKYRPPYPQSVYDIIMDFILHDRVTSTKAADAKLDCAVDLGCGSGQSTLPLLQYFRSVIGTDVSESQVEQAKQTHQALQAIKFM